MTKIHLQNLGEDVVQKIESNSGSNITLPISANDVTETTVRQFISPSLKSKITRNEEDITALSRVLDGYNEVITNANLTDEKVKLDAYDTAGFLVDKVDGTTIVRSGDKLVVKGINGVTVDINKINMLSGATKNIQEQIDSISSVVSVQSIVNTKSDLPVEIPNAGSTVLVRLDEEHDGVSTFYTSNGTSWEYVGKIHSDLARDFTTEPIDLVIETSGILPKDKYEKQNALETSFDGTNSQFLSTNTEDAIKEVKSYAKDGINTLTTNLASTNSIVNGIKGDLQITNDKLVTNETLATEAKTLAQQAFQSGNSTKQDVVAQLLLKDPKLPITSSSTWSEVNNSISQIKTGITPIGQEITLKAKENILEGNLVTVLEHVKHDHATLVSDINFQGLTKINYAYLSDSRVAVLYKNSQGGLTISILKYENEKITVLAKSDVTTVAPNGDNPNFIALTKNLMIVQCKSNISKSILIPVYITDDNVMTIRSITSVSAQNDSGNYGGLVRYSNNTFGALYRNVASEKVGITNYTINDTGTSVVEDNYINNIIDGAWDATCVWTGEDANNVYFSAFSYSPSISNLIAKSMKYNKSSKTVSGITGPFHANATEKSGQGQRPYLYTKKDGNKGIAVFHKGANNVLNLSWMNISSTGVISDAKTKVIVNVSGAGYISTSGEEKTHSATEISPGVFYLVYKSSTGTDSGAKDLSYAFVDMNQDDPILFGQKLIHSQGRYRYPLIMHFGGDKYGLCVQGDNNTSIHYEVINPSTTDVARVAKGNDIVKGIAISGGNANEEIKIVIPNAN